MGGFPENYPDDLLVQIMDDGAEYQELHVFRVARFGANNRAAFYSTFEDRITRDEVTIRDFELARENGKYDIGEFSTSCWQTSKQAAKILKLIKKHEPAPIILEGDIKPSTGPSMLTANSKSHREAGKGHIDWWVFKDADPSPSFCSVE